MRLTALCWGNYNEDARRSQSNSLLRIVPGVKHPYLFERNFLLYAFVYPVIAGKKLVYDVDTGPEAHPEKLRFLIFDDGLFEAAPRNEQAKISPNVCHGAYELVKNSPFDWTLRGLYLHADFRRGKTKAAGGSEKVNTMIGTLRAMVYGESFRLENCAYYALKRVTLIIADDEVGNIVKRLLFEIPRGGG